MDFTLLMGFVRSLRESQVQLRQMESKTLRNVLLRTNSNANGIFHLDIILPNRQLSL